MATRVTYTSASGDFTGAQYADNVAAHLKRLYDAAGFPLKSVGGTANAVTATLDPVLDGSGLVDGMRFTITWSASNTAGMTLNINAGGAVPVLDAEGAALVAGAVGSGLRSLIEYIGGNFRVLTPLLIGGGISGSESYYWAFTSSGTWNKPAGLDPDRMVIVELWGAGGGGASMTGGGSAGTGGAGGAYFRRMFRASQLPASVSIAIGAGGAGGVGSNVNGSPGGATTFGALMSAGGGGAGLASTSTAPGGGSSATADERGASALPAVAGTGALRAGGSGGGAAVGSVAGGASLLGGDGGASGFGVAGTAGAAPSGGGGAAVNGNGGAGARGEARIWIT